MSSNRKSSFKVPPPKESQETRRLKLLAEQKKKRHERYDSLRHLEAFSELAIDSDEDGVADVAREGIAAFANKVQSTPKSSALKGSKQSKWANKCMYAELLEMAPSPSSLDGLPGDLETAWTIVSPVPVGKRCLAITHQSSGPTGMLPNTTLKSRVVGKTLIASFPTPLPPLTVLDCILDVDWKQNGILHVLDVLRWKGQDIASSEVPFRMWWRDARLSEIQPLPPPVSPESEYRFRYPTLLSPIPWRDHFDLPTLVSAIIPQAAQARVITNIVPTSARYSADDLMDLDSTSSLPLQRKGFALGSDGLLLYVSEATYESGTSPLSLWVPIAGLGDRTDERPLSRFAGLVQERIKASRLTEDVEM